MDQLSPICLYEIFYIHADTRISCDMKWNMWGLRGRFFIRFVEQFSIVVICCFFYGVRISYGYEIGYPWWTVLALSGNIMAAWILRANILLLNFPFKWTRIWSWLWPNGNMDINSCGKRPYLWHHWIKVQWKFGKKNIYLRGDDCWLFIRLELSIF